VTITSRASSALTHTMASLATSSGRTVGRCSTAYDNTTNKDEEVAASLLFTTGTTPTVGGIIEAWVIPQREDGTWPDIFTASYTGTDGGFTIRSRDHLRGAGALLGAVPVLSTSDLPYVLAPRNVALLCGLNLARMFTIFVTHSTGVNANSTSGNHETIVLPSYWA
jgi:hypothetical protein